jgi:hypothetical protein
MMPETCTIFVNAVPVEAVRGETVIQAIERWDGAVAEQLRAGERGLADSRGVVAGLDMVVHGGAIFRVVSGRQVQDDETSAFVE